MKRLKASTNPTLALQKITYEGQPANLRRYVKGYETFFNRMPLLIPNDVQLTHRVNITKEIMEDLADELKLNPFLAKDDPGPNGFNRNIIALEEPVEVPGMGSYKEGVELIVASWGDGFTSPVHGHARGYLHEAIIRGKVRVNTYRAEPDDDNVVRPYKVEIASSGTFASVYTKPAPGAGRDVLVHNFTSIGHSTTLHYLPEHTRDGRDNKYKVRYFEDDIDGWGLANHVKRISAREGLYSRVGDVILVRSSNVPEYGDHYIVITGHPVVKEHGLRPQDWAIPAGPYAGRMIDEFAKDDALLGLVLLKLDNEYRDLFLNFHSIQFENDKLVFPTIL